MTDFYWLSQTLSALPFALLMYALNGTAWALVALPRPEWHQRATVTTLAILAGGATVSAILLILGVLAAILNQPLLNQTNALIAVGILTAFGISLAWRKRQRTHHQRTPYSPHAWQWDERLLLVLVLMALMVRWTTTAFWTFTAYDALWVYGSQPRLYILTGMIPHTIDYYPQFLQLQFTFLQLAVGNISDHAARVAVMALHLGSMLAVYALGMRLFGRRIAVYAMALWTLYPHVSEWAYVADLEIPLAHSFTLTALFFLQAWHADNKRDRRQWALLSGLVFGVAMWTKPTAGAFVWGVILLVALDFMRVRANWRAHLPRFEVAFITGLACIPLGSVWYLRNIALGHDAVRFPHPSWLELATRSADMFGWLLLTLSLLIAYLALTRTSLRWWRVLAGGILLALGVLPSLPLLNPARTNPPHSYIQIHEVLLILGGLALILWALAPRLRHIGRDAHIFLWAYLLALPYFITWFYSYSYHARLSFAIVPLLLMPSAYLIVRIADAVTWQNLRRFAYTIIIVMLSLMGIIGTYLAPAPYDDWLWTDRYPNDHARYKVQTPELVLLWDYLTGYEREEGTPARIMASGEQRLPFFFPLNHITTHVVPTRIDELQGYTHFIYGSLARWRYEDEAITPRETQIVAALGRRDIFEPYFIFNDGIFRYELYELHPDRRFDENAIQIGNRVPDEVVFGDWGRYLGHSISTREFSYGFTVYTDLAWQARQPAPHDYTLEIAVVNPDTGEVVHTWSQKPVPHEHGYYDTRLWQTDEYILWQTRFDYPLDAPPLPCGTYDFRLSFFTVDATGTRHDAPITINNMPVDHYAMPEPFTWSPCS